MRILVVSSYEGFRLPVQAACLQYEGEAISLRLADTIGQGLDLAHQIEAQLIIIDLTRNIEAGLIAVEQLAREPGRMVAVSLDKLTPDVVTRAVRAGAQDYLAQPVQEEDVHQVITKAKRIVGGSGTAPERAGKLIVCFSSKGGVGKTTISVNVAQSLAQSLGPGTVGVVDANTQAPNVAPMLDLRPDRWLRDAIAEYQRIDSEMLLRLATRHPSGMDVLPHSAENPLEFEFQEDHLSKILLVCKGTYEYTLVDTFPILSSLNLAIMDLADHVLLITEAVVPAVRSARHNLQVLRQAGYSPGRITVVLNRYTRFRGNIVPDLVAEALDWPVEVVLPYDVHTTIAANTGQTMVEAFPDLPLSNEFRRLAARLSGVVTESSVRRSWMERALQWARGE